MRAFHFSQAWCGFESISNDIFNSSAILKNQRKIKACNTKCNTKNSPSSHTTGGDFSVHFYFNGRCQFLHQIIAISVLEWIRHRLFLQPCGLLDGLDRCLHLAVTVRHILACLWRNDARHLRLGVIGDAVACLREVGQLE